MSILREFTLCWDEGQQQYYAFRGITGETIYGATAEGDVTGLDRSMSAWRRPYEDQPNALNIPVFSRDDSTELWGRQKPMSDDAAMALWEKKYDFGTGFFFYVSKQDGETVWTKPPKISPNLPCDDLLQENAPTSLLETGNVEQVEEEPIDNPQNEESTNWDETRAEDGGGSGNDGVESSWVEVYDNEVVYWMNESSGEVTYDDPYALAVVPEIDLGSYEESTQQEEIPEYDASQLDGFQGAYQEESQVEEEEYHQEEFDDNRLILPEIIKPQHVEIEKQKPFSRDVDNYDERSIRKRISNKSEPCQIRVSNFDASLTGGRLKGGTFKEMYGKELSRHNKRSTPYSWPEAREDPGPGGDADEGKLPWITTRALNGSLKPLQFLDQGSLHDGPYIRRRGAGRQMVRAINRLPEQADPEDRVNFAAYRGDKLFVNAGDVNYEEWQLGDKLTCFDGKEPKGTSLEPMMLCRAAYEDGPEALVEMMGKYLDREDVQVFGLINLAKFEYTETSHGYANPGGMKVLKTCLQVMKGYPENEALQGKALMVLAQLSDNYAMRRELFKVDWVSPTINAMNNNQENVNEMWVDHGGERGKEKITIREPTRHAIDTCLWSCKLFGQMACDNEKRPLVADDGIPLFLAAMRTCPEEAIVQLTAVKGLYNCVYRCESAHIMATEEDALDAVENLLLNFSSDPQLILLAQRTIRSLQADGWRGSADDPSSVIPQPVKYEVSELSATS